MRKTILNLASNERRRFARRRTALARLATDDDVMPSYPSDVEAILDLPAKHRAVLYLVYVEQMPYREVAEQLGMTPVAARKTASRAKRRARLDLEVDHG